MVSDNLDICKALGHNKEIEGVRMKENSRYETE